MAGQGGGFLSPVLQILTIAVAASLRSNIVVPVLNVSSWFRPCDS